MELSRSSCSVTDTCPCRSSTETLNNTLLYCPSLRRWATLAVTDTCNINAISLSALWYPHTLWHTLSAPLTHSITQKYTQIKPKPCPAAAANPRSGTRWRYVAQCQEIIGTDRPVLLSHYLLIILLRCSDPAVCVKEEAQGGSGPPGCSSKREGEGKDEDEEDRTGRCPSAPVHQIPLTPQRRRKSSSKLLLLSFMTPSEVEKKKEDCCQLLSRLFCNILSNF